MSTAGHKKPKFIFVAGFLGMLNTLKKAAALQARNNPLLLSASTAFFTTFTLSPILILVAQLLDIFFDSRFVLSRLFIKISGAIGTKSAEGIKKIVENFLSLENSFWVKTGITIFFIFIVTTLFGVIRQAIHLIWDIKKKPGKGFLFHARARLLEIGMIALIGVLFTATIYLDNGLATFQHTLHDMLPGGDRAVITMINIFLSIVITSAWFMVVFKMLPEVYLRWRAAIAGGLITGVLFNIGKFILSSVLTGGIVDKVFGPSSAIALLLLFIFYCSFILYFGAAFTFEYAKSIHYPIHPDTLSDKYEKQVDEKGKPTRQGRSRIPVRSKDKKP
jgi:membrane protein